MTLALPYFVDFSPDGMRQLREDLNMTQTELARLLGCTREAVWRWETGINSPRQTILRDQIRELAEERDRKKSR